MSQATNPTPEGRYALATICLHWLIFFLVSTCVAIVWYADDLDDRALHRQLVDWHRSIGITIMALMLLRLVVSLMTQRPGHTLRHQLQQRMIQLVHAGFYAALMAIPMLGWLMTNASGKPLSWFGIFTLPSLTGRDRDFAETLHDLHTNSAELLLIVIGLHAGMALWHHFRDQDNSLSRILPPPLANRFQNNK